MIGLLLALALAADPQAVVADPAAAHPATEGVKTEWVAAPTGSQMAAIYAKGGFPAGASGRAVVSCIVEKDGSVSDCRVVEETPAGTGFGAATLKASKYVRMKQVDAAGKPTFGASVRIPMQWNPPLN